MKIKYKTMAKMIDLVSTESAKLFDMEKIQMTNGGPWGPGWDQRIQAHDMMIEIQRRSQAVMLACGIYSAHVQGILG